MAIYKSNEPTKDGRSWYFSTYYIDLDGINKKYKSKKYELKKEAQKAERLFLSTYTEKHNNKNMIFKDLILDYENFQKSKVKVTTFRHYKTFFDKLSSLEKVKIKNFNIQTFNMWKNEINKLKISTTSKNGAYKSLRALLNYAVKYHNYIELIPTLNKMTNFNNPNELKKEMKFYTLDEFRKFIEQELDLKYKCFFETLYFCGIRKGEANALTWNDVDFSKQTININKNVSLKIKGKKYVILPPKTKSSNRTLPIPKVLLNDLKMLKNEMKQYKNFFDSWFVFGGHLPLADTTIQNHNISNTKKAKLKKNIRIHDFRHSCASLLISNGASIALVAKYLGHSNITTTLNTYTHMFKNEFNDIIYVIDNL